jgi:hypothetical protein
MNGAFDGGTRIVDRTAARYQLSGGKASDHLKVSKYPAESVRGRRLESTRRYIKGIQTSCSSMAAANTTSLDRTQQTIRIFSLWPSGGTKRVETNIAAISD